MGCMVVGPISKMVGAGASAGSTVSIGMIAGASAGSTAGITLIMAGAAMGGMIGMRSLTIGAAIGGRTIAIVAAWMTGVADNSNNVVKQHVGDQE